MNVDEHAHSYKEVGYEYGVAHKFKPPHERGASGYETVEHKSGEECPEHTFKPYPRCHCGREEHHHHYVDELLDAVVVFLEEIACQTRVYVIYHRAVQHKRCEHSQQRAHRAVPHDADHTGEHYEGAEYGHDGAGYGYDDCRGACDAETCHDRIGKQCVRGKHRCKQCGLREPHVKQGYGRDSSEEQRYEEREGSEHEPFGQILLKMVHVDLYAGEKHEVEYTYLAEHFEAHVPVKQGETVGADGHTRNYEPYDMRYLQAVEQQRGHKDYRHHRKEDGHRLCDDRHSHECPKLRDHSTANLLKIPINCYTFHQIYGLKFAAVTFLEGSRAAPGANVL